MGVVEDGWLWEGLVQQLPLQLPQALPRPGLCKMGLEDCPPEIQISVLLPHQSRVSTALCWRYPVALPCYGIDFPSTHKTDKP